MYKLILITFLFTLSLLVSEVTKADKSNITLPTPVLKIITDLVKVSGLEYDTINIQIENNNSVNAAALKPNTIIINTGLLEYAYLDSPDFSF